MKNENNIEKSIFVEKSIFYRIFYRSFSFIGFRGLLYFFFPLSEISQWQELKAGAQKEISEFKEKQNKIKKKDNTITKIQKAIEENEQALDTPKVPVNKKLPSLGSPVKISPAAIQESIKRTQAANRNKDIREENERNKEKISEMQGRQADKQEELQRKYDMNNIRSLESDIAYATYCIDNFHKCSYDLNKLFLQAVKTQERKVAQLLLMNFKDKIDFDYKDASGNSALQYAQDNVDKTNKANIPELMFNESFYNFLRGEVGMRYLAHNNPDGKNSLNTKSSSLITLDKVKKVEENSDSDTASMSSTSNNSSGSDDDYSDYGDDHNRKP